MLNLFEISPDFSKIEGWSKMTPPQSHDAQTQEIVFQLRDLAKFADDEFMELAIDAKEIPLIAGKVREKLHEHLRAFADSYTTACDLADAGHLSSARRTLLDLAHKSSSPLIRHKCMIEIERLGLDDQLKPV